MFCLNNRTTQNRRIRFHDTSGENKENEFLKSGKGIYRGLPLEGKALESLETTPNWRSRVNGTSRRKKPSLLTFSLFAIVDLKANLQSQEQWTWSGSLRGTLLWEAKSASRPVGGCAPCLRPHPFYVVSLLSQAIFQRLLLKVPFTAEWDLEFNRF